MLKKFATMFLAAIISFLCFTNQTDAAIRGNLKVKGRVEFAKYMYTKAFHSNDGEFRIRIKSWGQSGGSFMLCAAEGKQGSTRDIACRNVPANTRGNTHAEDWYVRSKGTYSFNFYATDHYGSKQYVDYWIYD
ncbi:MAG: hypothetical protein WB502_06045 [Thermoactinomyces sp.]